MTSTHQSCCHIFAVLLLFDRLKLFLWQIREAEGGNVPTKDLEHWFSGEVQTSTEYGSHDKEWILVSQVEKDAVNLPVLSANVTVTNPLDSSILLFLTGPPSFFLLSNRRIKDSNRRFWTPCIRIVCSFHRLYALPVCTCNGEQMEYSSSPRVSKRCARNLSATAHSRKH